MNNTTDNEKIKKTVQKPCSNTSENGANPHKTRTSAKSVNMSPMMREYNFANSVDFRINTRVTTYL